MNHRSCHCRELPQNELYLCLFRAIAGVVPKLLLKRTTAGRRILSTTSLTFFEVLLSMIVLPKP
jgi:hypothetical protein